MKKIKLLFILFIVIFSSNLYAKILNCTHKITNKQNEHSIQNVDFTYLINLDERPEKLAVVMNQLAPYGIHPYRFSAVNGWKLSFKTINDSAVKYKPWMVKDLMSNSYLPADHGEPHNEIMHVLNRSYFAQGMSRGAIGILLSHLSILKDAYDSGYNTIWVLEDNIQVIKDPRMISSLITKLDAQVGKDGWDILFTDKDTKGSDGKYVICRSAARLPDFEPANPQRFLEEKIISADFKRIGARYGAYSMIVRRSGMKKILDFVSKHQGFLPYDMEYTLPDDIRLYSTNYDVVSTRPKTASDNGSPSYSSTLKTALRMSPTLADYWHDYRIRLSSAIRTNSWVQRVEKHL